jgi:hypothetical protein
MTPARKAALRKAQAASARARRGTGKAARSTGRTVKRGAKRVNAKRKANIQKTYGKNWKSANRLQKVNRVSRNINRAYIAGAVGVAGYGLAMESAAGKRYQNRQSFKKQYGKPAYKAAKAKYKSNVKAQRARRRNPGPTTMSWGPRSSGMAALPRGRGSNQKRARR